MSLGNLAGNDRKIPHRGILLIPRLALFRQELSSAPDGAELSSCRKNHGRSPPDVISSKAASLAL